jgi:hypothetical protein
MKRQKTEEHEQEGGNRGGPEPDQRSIFLVGRNKMKHDRAYDADVSNVQRVQKGKTILWLHA